MINVRSSLPEERITLDDGSEIGCYTGGNGPMSIVLLHGLNSYSGTWKKNVDFLSKYGRVVAPTLPRVSLDRDAPRDFVPSLSRTVLSLMDAKHFRSATLFGNSMGGWICMYIAIHHPERVNGIVLVDTAGVLEHASSEPHPSEILGKVNHITQPVLIVWGEDDEVLPVGLAHALHGRIKQSKLEIVRGAGHIPHLQKPEAFNATVASFFAEHEKELVRT